jgi:VanZ family protein
MRPRLLLSQRRAMCGAMNKSLAWKLALLWAVVIFILSSIPGKSLPAVAVLGYDKLLHAIVYAVLGALCCLSLAGTVPLRLAISVATLLAVVYGLTDEFHQMFIPGRSADLRDVVADGLGGLIGAGAVAAIGAMRN